ncbi:MAG: glycine C-acetyltransferase [Planctomycetes bacterium]|nr:glycine C-acetyltransferase [Planctomycetota bacterium]
MLKPERVLQTPQGARVRIDGREVVNLCANNYLGLSGDPRLVRAAAAGLERWGFGLSSVRFICGTQEVHRELEAALAGFLGCDDAQLYGSCFDANGAVFEPLLGEDDAIVSDALNHASIIDGVRLCKARRFRYANADLADLEVQLTAARAGGARRVLIVTDGVFSMDGVIAPLPGICALADRFGALVMVDDSHAVGFIGANGRGTHEHHAVMGRIDILTGTLGKALGGASGGYIAGRREIIAWLRQRARPYLFSNTLAPAIAAATLEALRLVEREGAAQRARLAANAARFRAGMAAQGFTLVPGGHPIIPVMLGDAVLAQRMAAGLLARGVLAVGFCYPVVPQGKARIRTQMSAAHADADLDTAIAAFAATGRELGLIA